MADTNEQIHARRLKISKRLTTQMSDFKSVIVVIGDKAHYLSNGWEFPLEWGTGKKTVSYDELFDIYIKRPIYKGGDKEWNL